MVAYHRQRQDVGEVTEADRLAEEEAEILRHATQARQALKTVKELAQVCGDTSYAAKAGRRKP